MYATHEDFWHDVKRLAEEPFDLEDTMGNDPGPNAQSRAILQWSATQASARKNGGTENYFTRRRRKEAGKKKGSGFSVNKITAQHAQGITRNPETGLDLRQSIRDTTKLNSIPPISVNGVPQQYTQGSLIKNYIITPQSILPSDLTINSHGFNGISKSVQVVRAIPQSVQSSKNDMVRGCFKRCLENVAVNEVPVKCTKTLHSRGELVFVKAQPEPIGSIRPVINNSLKTNPTNPTNLWPMKCGPPAVPENGMKILARALIQSSGQPDIPQFEPQLQSNNIPTQVTRVQPAAQELHQNAMQPLNLAGDKYSKDKVGEEIDCLQRQPVPFKGAIRDILSTCIDDFIENLVKADSQPMAQDPVLPKMMSPESTEIET